MTDLTRLKKSELIDIIQGQQSPNGKAMKRLEDMNLMFNGLKDKSDASHYKHLSDNQDIYTDGKVVETFMQACDKFIDTYNLKDRKPTFSIGLN